MSNVNDWFDAIENEGNTEGKTEVQTEVIIIFNEITPITLITLLIH